MLRIPALLALLVFTLLPGGAAMAQPAVLAPSGLWVTDTADLLPPNEEAALTAKLRGYADTTSTQIVVVTIPTLGGGDAASYAIALGEQWRVGQGGKDNGVVILVSRDDRKMFIATGLGVEGSIPDAVASTIVRNVMVPRFREGNFYAGLSDAVDALVAAARGEFEADPAAEGRGGGGGSLLLILILIVVVLTVSNAMRGGGGPGGRRRYRSGFGGPPVIIWGGGGFGGGGFGGGGGGGGGFSGGGGSFGGGGAGGDW